LSGFLLKKHFVYILAAPFSILFSYLNTIIFSWFGGNDGIAIISELVSIQKPFMTAIDIDYVGAKVDLLFIIQSCAALLFVALLFCIIGIAAKKLNSVKIIILTLICTTMLITLSSIYIKLFPTQYTFEDKLYVIEFPEQSFTISSYSGNIILSEYGRYECIVDVSSFDVNIARALTFRLDECFCISDITLAGNEISYAREGDYIMIQAGDIPNVESFQLMFSYNGRVQYISDIDGVNIFTSYFASALPSNFAFLPIIDGDMSVKTYDFTVESRNTLISNIDTAQVEGSKYRLSGESNSLCLFSGFLTEFVSDGIVFYRTKYNQETNYLNEYRDSLSRNYFDPYKGTIKEGSYPTPKKVFMIYDLYGVLGFPVVYGDYVMLNYGFPM
jgi:hypothetical protein